MTKTKTKLLIAVASLLFLAEASSQAGQWVQSRKVISGACGNSRTCLIHNITDIPTAWEPTGDENYAVIETAFACCQEVHVYSHGNVTKTYQWVHSDPAHPENDPPPTWQYVTHYVGLDHFKNVNDSYTYTSAGTASCNFGVAPDIVPSPVYGHSFMYTASGEVTFNYELESDVTVGPGYTAHACVSVVTVTFSSSYDGPPAQWVKVSPWEYAALPTYPVNLSTSTSHTNFCPGDPVNLATGEHIYSPNYDLTVYNPYGPSAVFQRNFLSSLSKDGKHSSGLPIGWNHGYDMRIVAQTPDAWGSMRIVYPNDAEETAVPEWMASACFITESANSSTKVVASFFIEGVLRI